MQVIFTEKFRKVFMQEFPNINYYYLFIIVGFIALTHSLTHTLTRTRARTHAHTHTHARARTHTHTHKHIYRFYN